MVGRKQTNERRIVRADIGPRMHRRGKRAPTLLFIGGLSLLGCTEREPSPEDAASTSDAGSVSSGCPEWAPDLTYGERTGLMAADDSGDVAARVVAASHVPARVGENTWQVRLENSRGEPLEDLAIRWACAFNPSHGHGFAPELAPGAASGQIEISALRFWVEGGWEVQLWVDPVDSGKAEYQPVTPCRPIDEQSRVEDIALRVCVPER